ncbi:putative RNA-binding Zn-ribbon protein involved in translation (DUF1610 family) [Aequitasia blattaphilus]|uniref:LITAF domain-containing protein n=1 Tax=Aequitasia blattaphilus TaxID=2949332 RepID=A0ABT1E7P1_9FIRM|nr:hypothetical protein [Aequitasia blattaphilus]MCP1101726.1 hypothetical protein [Aequitasia blattaphilus]MCR8614366.1 hypothetical protein [Aequitasia blattaphilus]
MICPRCGSNHITSQVITETTSNEKVKGFGWIKACIGFLLFSLPGVLCGLCGMGKGRRSTKTSSKVEYTCQNCGNRF